jgi:hypothetical protein
MTEFGGSPEAATQGTLDELWHKTVDYTAPDAHGTGLFVGVRDQDTGELLDVRPDDAPDAPKGARTAQFDGVIVEEFGFPAGAEITVTVSPEQVHDVATGGRERWQDSVHPPVLEEPQGQEQERPELLISIVSPEVNVPGAPLMARQRLVLIKPDIIEPDDGEIVRQLVVDVIEELHDESGQVVAQSDPDASIAPETLDTARDALAMGSTGLGFTEREARGLINLMQRFEENQSGAAPSA